MSYKLTEEYPLKPEVDMTHDLSKGLKRHWPEAYDELGRYRERPIRMPWPLAVMLVVGALMVAKAL